MTHEKISDMVSGTSNELYEINRCWESAANVRYEAANIFRKYSGSIICRCTDWRIIYGQLSAYLDTKFVTRSNMVRAENLCSQRNGEFSKCDGATAARSILYQVIQKKSCDSASNQIIHEVTAQLLKNVHLYLQLI